MNLKKAVKTQRRNGRLYKFSIDTPSQHRDSRDYRFSPLSLPSILKHTHGSNGQESHADDRRRKEARRPNTKPGKTAKASAESRPLALERRAPSASDASGTHVRELEALTQSLLHAREQQRQDISRELHDNIAQVLAATANRISLAKDQCLQCSSRSSDDIASSLRDELQDLRNQLQSAIEDVRTLAREMRPAMLDHFSFAAALEKHAEAFRERTRMTLSVRVDADGVGILPPDHLTHLFRLAQEALQNIEEHSEAKHAWIELSHLDGAMHLEIGDDGHAFTPERVTQAQRDGHLGLLGMRERAELLGGQFILEAKPGQGTVIRITIPPSANLPAGKTPEPRL